MHLDAIIRRLQLSEETAGVDELAVRSVLESLHKAAAARAAGEDAAYRQFLELAAWQIGDSWGWKNTLGGDILNLVHATRRAGQRR